MSYESAPCDVLSDMNATAYVNTSTPVRESFSSSMGHVEQWTEMHVLNSDGKPARSASFDYLKYL